MQKVPFLFLEMVCYGDKIKARFQSNPNQNTARICGALQKLPLLDEFRTLDWKQIAEELMSLSFVKYNATTV